MGLLDAAAVKEKLREMAPDAAIKPDAVEETLKCVRHMITDGTLELYTCIEDCGSWITLFSDASSYLTAISQKYGKNTSLHVVFDVGNKPVAKNVLRDAKTERTPPFTEMELSYLLIKVGNAGLRGVSLRDLEGATNMIFASGIAQGLANENDVPFVYFLARALRTPDLRYLLFWVWIEVMIEQMNTDFPPLDELHIDGYLLPMDDPAHKMRRKISIKYNTAWFRMEMNQEHGEYDTAGEADLRIVETIARICEDGGKNIMVRSRDTDGIFVLLSDVENWSADTHVVLNLGPPKWNTGDELLVIRVLRTQIREWQLVRYPAIEIPHFERAATLVFFLGGNDYVERPPSVGIARIWEFFESVGYAFFHQADLKPRRKPNAMLSWRNYMMRIMTAFVHAMISADFKKTQKAVVRYARGEVLKETVHGMFNPHVEDGTRPVWKAAQARTVIMSLVPSIPELCEEAVACERTKPLQGLVPMDEDRLRVYCAQTIWSYMYAHHIIADALQMDEGKSLWGWSRAENGVVVRAASVL